MSQKQVGLCLMVAAVLLALVFLMNTFVAWTKELNGGVLLIISLFNWLFFLGWSLFRK